MIARWSRLVSIVTCGIVAFAVGAKPSGQQVRDNAPAPPTGTSTIAGRVVVAGDAKQPARRVRVTLAEASGAIPGQTTTTDDTGAFAFTSLPAGRFELAAVKPGYLRGSYGASRPDRAGTPIVVKDGESVSNRNITIARGGVITGAVRDARGQPVPDVPVRVLRFSFNALTGERTLGTPSSGSFTTTDDRGEYRAYGLPPGMYLVLATPGPPGRAGGPSIDDIRPLSSAELQQAMRAARATASNTTSPPVPTPSPASVAYVNYAPVFHPGVTDIGAATTITLALGEERTASDISIQFVRTASIAGKISDPSGVLPRMLSLSLVPAGPQTELLAGAGLRGINATVRPDGSYVFGGVAPGSYTIKASSAQGASRGLATPQQAGQAMWATVEVTVNGNDLDVPLTLQPGLTINGRVVFEGAQQPTAADMQALTFRLMGLGSGGGLLSNPGGRVDAEGRFTFADMTPGSYRFATQWTSPVSSKWTIKSSIANGRDAFDAPVLVYPNLGPDWVVTYTDSLTTLSGVFTESSGRAATDYFILVFPTDRRLWTPGSRRVRTLRPATDGAFATTGLLEGEYYVAALTDLEPGEWNDPTLLEQLSSSAVKVSLREGTTTRQDLRIGGSRE